VRPDRKSMLHPGTLRRIATADAGSWSAMTMCMRFKWTSARAAAAARGASSFCADERYNTAFGGPARAHHRGANRSNVWNDAASRPMQA
jgi:hypothetical protein